MSCNGKKLLQNTITVSVGCGCRKSKLFNVFLPKPKTKLPTYRESHLYRSSSSSWERSGHGGRSVDDEDDTTTTNTNTNTFSPNVDTSPQYSEAEYDPRCSKTVRGSGKLGESIAVVKDSDDPYLDFRHSMLQMILEKEIYSREDLRHLLECFLQLNSPNHHEIIIRAFTEIWNGVFSVRPGSSKRLRRHKSREF